MDLALGFRVFFTAPRNDARHPGLVSARERRARYPESAAETAAATTLDTSTPSAAVRWA